MALPVTTSSTHYPDGLVESRSDCSVLASSSRVPRQLFPCKTFDNCFELACGAFLFFFFILVFFPRILRPPPSTRSIVDPERYMSATSFFRSASLYLIGVADATKELLAYLGMYAARRGFLLTLTSVEVAPPSSSLSGLLLAMQPCNARFHHGFSAVGTERAERAERCVHDRCRIFIG